MSGMSQKFILTFGDQTPKSSAFSGIALQLVDIQQRSTIPMTELLTALRENRRGKGLYVEPTDRQVIQIWGQADFFQETITRESFPNALSTSSLAIAPRKSVQHIIRLRIQYVARIFLARRPDKRSRRNGQDW
jgi:hypothetical protein